MHPQRRESHPIGGYMENGVVVPGEGCGKFFWLLGYMFWTSGVDQADVVRATAQAGKSRICLAW